MILLDVFTGSLPPQIANKILGVDFDSEQQQAPVTLLDQWNKGMHPENKVCN